MSKKILASLFVGGLVFYGHHYMYKPKPSIDLANKHNLLIHFKLNCEQTVLLSKQIADFTQKNLSSKIKNSEFLLSNISDKTDCVKVYPNKKSFSNELFFYYLSLI